MGCGHSTVRQESPSADRKSEAETEEAGSLKGGSRETHATLKGGPNNNGSVVSSPLDSTMGNANTTRPPPTAGGGTTQQKEGGDSKKKGGAASPNNKKSSPGTKNKQKNSQTTKKSNGDVGKEKSDKDGPVQSPGNKNSSASSVEAPNTVQRRPLMSQSQADFFRILDEKIESAPDYVPSDDEGPRHFKPKK